MAKKEIVKIGLVGHGPRGEGILKVMANIPGVEIVAVCDIKEECLKKAEETLLERKGYKPLLFTDYDEMIKIEEIDAIVNTACWTGHIDFAVKAMEAGKDVAIEVGGAYSVRDCWRLVEAQKKTKKRCMMLENCCYGRVELAVLNMVRKGLFGTPIACRGGYSHDLRKEFFTLCGVGMERVLNHQSRNCDNYPTHALGPIAKLLDINKGNRMVSLVSTSSKACGMEEYCNEHCEPDHYLYGSKYVQGDVITTTIKCARGETITLELGVTLPRPYSRHFEIQGSKGMYSEDGQFVYLESEYKDAEHPKAKDLYNNAEKYIEQNDHPIWEEKLKQENVEGESHGGMDGLVCRAFIDSIKEDTDTPIDVYDCASWMCISALSEESILKGSTSVAIPDFTDGKWIMRKFEQKTKWSI